MHLVNCNYTFLPVMWILFYSSEIIFHFTYLSINPGARTCSKLTGVVILSWSSRRTPSIVIALPLLSNIVHYFIYFCFDLSRYSWHPSIITQYPRSFYKQFFSCFFNLIALEQGSSSTIYFFASS